MQGAKVVISSRKQDACDAVAAEINARHGAGTAIAIAANISSKERLQNLVDETRKAFGKITALVCNAASNPYYGPGLGITDEQFRKILDNNILSQPLADLHGGARNDRAGRRFDHNHFVDWRLERFADDWCLWHFQGGRHADGAQFCDRIRAAGRVASIASPRALIRTDMARALVGKSGNVETINRAAASLKRIGEPPEIAGAVVFLASRAGAFTTGQTIVCDGGVTITGRRIMGALKGKVAIITGAGSGIGRASAIRFAAEGAKLVIGDKSEAVHETAKLIGAGRVTALQIDAGVEADVAKLVATALSTYGGLDVAFANAGIIGDMGGIFDIDPAAMGGDLAGQSDRTSFDGQTCGQGNG